MKSPMDYVRAANASTRPAPPAARYPEVTVRTDGKIHITWDVPPRAGDYYESSSYLARLAANTTVVDLDDLLEVASRAASLAGAVDDVRRIAAVIDALEADRQRIVRESRA